MLSIIKGGITLRCGKYTYTRNPEGTFKVRGFILGGCYYSDDRTAASIAKNMAGYQAVVPLLYQLGWLDVVQHLLPLIKIRKEEAILKLQYEIDEHMEIIKDFGGNGKILFDQELDIQHKHFDSWYSLDLSERTEIVSLLKAEISEIKNELLSYKNIN